MRQPRFKRKAYKFPLKLEWFGKCFTADNNMAFDFCRESADSGWENTDIVNIINGDEVSNYTNMNLSYKPDESTIYANDKPFISIRNWGTLTSPICMGYKPHKAAQIQDEFAQFIIKKLAPNG